MDELYYSPDINSLGDNKLVNGSQLKGVLQDLQNVTGKTGTGFSQTSPVIRINSKFVNYGQITQTQLITFSVDRTGFMMPGGCALIKVVANGSGILFPGMKETTGSAGVDRTATVLNLITFFYDGSDVWYSVQQENNTTADVTAPEFITWEIPPGEPSTIIFTADEELDAASVPVAADFNIVDTTIEGVLTITDIAINFNAIEITISETLVGGVVVQAAYNGTAIQDISGNKMAVFSGQAVTNNLAIYDPSDYVTHVIAHFIKARSLDGTLTDGQNVSTLSNAGTKGGSYAPVGNAPTFQTNELNGTGIIRCVKASTQYLRTSSLHTLPNIYTKFIVVKCPAATSGCVAIHYSLFDQVDFGTSTNKYRHFTSNANRTPDPIAVTTSTYENQYVILTIIAGASSSIRRINGAVENTTAQAVTPATSSSNYQWIGYGGLGSPVDMDFAEYIFVEGEMSQSDIEKFEGYLAWSLGLVASLDIGHPYKSTPPTP